MNAEETGAIESQAACEFARAMSGSAVEGPRRLAVTQENAKKGLGQLVLTLVELIRELLERQALRRIEAGSLTEEQIERLGATFMQLAAQMQRLKKEFDLENEDLNIDLGPLGRLL
jgi:transposase